MKRWLNLLAIEWTKAKSFYAFGISIVAQLVVFVVLLVVGVNLNIEIEGVSISPFFEFPHIWTSFAWLLGWISLFTCFAFLVIVGAEFGERTFNFQLANGLKRYELLGAKVFLAIVLSVFWSLVLFVVVVIFGSYHTPSVELVDIYQGIEVSLFFFLRTFCLLTITLVIAFIIRNTALSILAFVVIIPFEAILRTLFPEVARYFFPLKALQNLAPMPDFFGLAVMNNPELAALKSTVTTVDAPLIPVEVTVAVVVLYSIISLVTIFLFLRKRSF